MVHFATKRHVFVFVLKETVLALLAVTSIGLVVYELLVSPDAQTQKTLNHFDFVVACIFLVDFAISLLVTKDRKKYLRHNWYFLLAAIPLTDYYTEALRGLRVLRIFRLLRAGEHMGFGAEQSRERT